MPVKEEEIKGRCPEGMDLLLPWYVNGTLDEVEEESLREHIAHCVICQRELQAVQHERGLYRSVMEEVPVPSTFSRLLSEIKMAERDGFWRKVLSLLEGPLEWPRPALVLLAVQAVLIVALVAVLSLNPWGVGEGLYRTLSGPQQVAFEGPRLQILFREDVPEQLIRETLLEIGGTIVRGPTPMGVYTIELPPGTSRQELQRILSTLRRKEFVRFVGVEGG
ncbi:MAG: hypothetical protein DRG69_05380 [Deltaproteobacteria bacterium]|nr:MAG: hypothetical protein DRG69_05380 [Deltaproteobacteria bacterium]